MAWLTIEYNGGRTETTDTLADALAAVRTEYPAACFVSYDGWVIDAATEAAIDSLATGPILVWEHAEASENDPGSRAIASITLQEA